MEKIILIVDNDVFSAKILSKLLSSLYKVYTFSTADDALNEIQKGLSPDVIMSTRILKGTDGLKFLYRMASEFPNSFRILITSEKDPKEVFEMVQQSRVNIFLNKPYNNLQVIQTLKLGLKAFDGSSSSAESNSSEDDLKNSIKVISNLIIEEEKYYFRPHTFDVIEICKVVGDTFEFSIEQKRNLIYTAFLHNFYLIGLPDLFRVTSPENLTDSFRNAFFNHFVKLSKNLSQLKSIEQYINFATMLFEHNDGSGKPAGMTGLAIPKEIQFLSMLNIYLNFVYRLNKNELETLKLEGRVVQSKQTTISKHQEAITYFYKNIKWFDHDIFYKFQDLIKKREILNLKFNSKDMILEMNERANVLSLLKEDEKRRYLKDLLFNNQIRVVVKGENGNIQTNYYEEKTSIKNLKVGDITTMPIVDYDNKQVVPAFFEHTATSLEAINDRLSSRQISEIVFRKIEIAD